MTPPPGLWPKAGKSVTVGDETFGSANRGRLGLRFYVTVTFLTQKLPDQSYRRDDGARGRLRHPDPETYLASEDGVPNPNRKRERP